MRLLALSLLLAGCAFGRSATIDARRQLAGMEAQEPPAPGVDPYAFPPLVGWAAGDGVSLRVTGPLRFQAAGEGLYAAVVTRHADDETRVVLIVARPGPTIELVGQLTLAAVPDGKLDPREVDCRLGRVALAGADEGVRADVATFQERGRHLFAIKTFVVGRGAALLLGRMLEDGSDARDRRATVEVKDLDGDGQNELIFEETEAGLGGRHRVVVYRRSAEGVFRSADPSIFE